MIASLEHFRRELAKYVKGQDEALKALTLVIYRHCFRAQMYFTYGRKLPGGFNILLKGPTGCGKSYIINKAAELSDRPVTTIDCSTLVREGYVGRSLIKQISDAFTEVELSSYPIIVLDEFDKIITGGTYGDTHQEVQCSLLKFVEGIEIPPDNDPQRKVKPMDTRKFLFIFSGAFSGENKKEKVNIGFNKEKGSARKTVYQKLIEYGAIPELAGRIKQIITLKQLTYNDYRNILNAEKSDHRAWIELFKLTDSKIELPIDKIISSVSTRELGARGLLQEVEKEINRILEKYQDELTFHKILGTGDDGESI